MLLEELQFMADKYIENMKNIGMVDETIIKNLDYYILEKLTAGSSLELNKDIEEETVDLPANPPKIGITSIDAEHSHTYTLDENNGGYTDFAYHPDNKNVKHRHKIIDGVIQGAQSNCYPDCKDFYGVDGTPPHVHYIGGIVMVPIGDISDLDETLVGTEERPFVIEKYMKINGEYMTVGEGIEQVKSSGTEEQNISDIFPGTLEIVLDDQGKEVGLTGELGVRYGLRFSLTIGGIKYRLTETELDVLDLPINEIQPLEANSKLLLCLINNLVDDNNFRIITKYIYPLNKVLATLGIYNDMAFIPSIGELIAEDAFEDNDWPPTGKPGKYATVGTSTVEIESGADGWAPLKERSPGPFAGNGLFLLHYDNWDQNLLLKSRLRIKKLFNAFYNSRDFDPNDTDQDSPSESFIASQRATYKPSIGQNLLPWWKRRLLRTNPFNANEELCPKKDKE